MLDYLYILGSVLFTVYGQLVLKWQVSLAGPMPAGVPARSMFFLKLIFNPWVLSGLLGGFMAFLCWMAAMTKFELSHVYPFMSLAFVLVLVGSAAFFNEAITAPKLTGVALIMAGIIVSSRG